MNQAPAIKVPIIAVDKVTGTVGALNKKIEAMYANAARIQQSMSASGFGKLSKSLSSFGTKQAIVTGAAGAGLFAIAKSAAERGDDIGKTARMLGMQVEAFQELKYAAGLANIETEKFTTSMKKFMKGAADASTGKGSVAELFRALGVNVKDAGGQMRTTENIFTDVTAAMNKISDPIMKNRVAMELFGREGSEMTLMMEGGTEQLQKLREEARRLGVITAEDAARSEVFNDALSRMQQGFLRLRDTVGLKMLPTLTQLADRLTETFIAKQPAIEAFALKLAENLPTIIDKLTEGFAAIGAAVMPFGKFMTGLADTIGPANLVLGTMAFIVGSKLVAAFMGLTTALKILNLAFTTSPVGMMLLGIGGAGLALATTIRHFQGLNRELKETDRLNKLLGAGPEVKTTDDNKATAVRALNDIYVKSFQNPGQWSQADEESLKRAEERVRGYGVDLPDVFADRVKMINDMASTGPGTFTWPGKAPRLSQGAGQVVTNKVDLKIGFDYQPTDQPQARPRVNGQPVDPRRGLTLQFQ